jgi:hypothetical protein
LLLAQGKSSKGYPKRENLQIEPKDMFRTDSYIKSCKTLLLNEFNNHYEYSIHGVMAECNNDYFTSREKMLGVHVSILWSSILPFMKRKKTADNTLIDLELNNEIEKQNEIKNCSRDGEIAINTNLIQYEENGQLIECKCCFGDYVFENLVQCTNGHLFCKSCIEKALNDGMYSSGKFRGKKMFCMTSESECNCEISEDSIKDAIPTILFDNYRLTFFEKALKDANLQIAQCPWCPYLEEAPKINSNILFSAFMRMVSSKVIQNMLSLFFIECFARYFGITWRNMYHYMNMSNIFVILVLYIYCTEPLTRNVLLLRDKFYNHKLFQWITSRKLYRYLFYKQNVLVLNCKKCLRASCIECKKEFQALHTCHEEIQDSLRIHVENAMSESLVFLNFTF